MRYSRDQIRVIAAAALVFALLFGVRQSQALFIGPLNTATGLGIAAISLAFAVAQLMWLRLDVVRRRNARDRRRADSPADPGGPDNEGRRGTRVRRVPWRPQRTLTKITSACPFGRPWVAYFLSYPIRS